jgi:hypothetical protein
MHATEHTSKSQHCTIYSILPEDQSDDKVTSMASLFGGHILIVKKTTFRKFFRQISPEIQAMLHLLVQSRLHIQVVSQAGNDSSYVNMLENHLFLIVAGSIQRYTCLREKNMCRDTSYFPALKFSYKF